MHPQLRGSCRSRCLPRCVVDDHHPSPPREPGRPVSRKGSSASASGLKKLLCSLSQSTKQRLGRFRCYSMEQLPAPGGSPPDGPGVKKSPSLQSLQLVSSDIAPCGGCPQGDGGGTREGMLGWDEVFLSMDLWAVLEGHGGMCRPKPAGFEKPRANWEVEGRRTERGGVVEEQTRLFLLSSELGSSPGGRDAQISSPPLAHQWVKHCGAAVRPHLNQVLFPRCHPSASPKKPPLSRACTPNWARHPVPAPTSCPRPRLTGRMGPGTFLLCPGRLFRGAVLVLFWGAVVAWCSQGLHHLVSSSFPSPLSPVPSPHRKGGSGPQRSLSVEDIGVPVQLRAVGRVVEVFPDGTSQLELQRPPHGAFGFSVTSGHGRPDTGIVGSSQSFGTARSLHSGSCPTPGLSLGMGGWGCSMAGEPQR